MGDIFLPDNLPKTVPLLDREKAAAYLSQAGFPVTKTRLAQLAISGGGPKYHKWGRRVLYKAEALLEWAEGRTSASRRSTSQSAPVISE